MATTEVLGLYKPDGSDYVSVERDLNENYQKIDDAFKDLFMTKAYQTVFSSVASGNKVFTNEDFDIAEITGYTPVALVGFVSSSANFILRGSDPSAFVGETANCIYCRNLGSSTISSLTITITVLWVKTDFLNVVPLP